MQPFIEASQGLAMVLGETQGRTTSRVIGQGLSDITGLDHDSATDIGHLLMIAAVAEPKARTPIVVGLGALFIAGLLSDS